MRNREVNQNYLRSLIEQQRYQCAMTGRGLTPDTAVLDHKVPVMSGGSHSQDNVQWVHEDVNKAKGTMKLREFTDLCLEVAANDLTYNG